MTKETKIEKSVRKLGDMYEFYKKIPKIQESEKNYSPADKSEQEQKEQ